MNRYDYDDYDDESEQYESSGEYYFDEPDGPDEDVDEDEDFDIPTAEHATGEHDVEISMEVDEDGNEVWRAEDSQIPGSTSKGHSLEQAMEGVEDRRREYREMLKRSREERRRRRGKK